ncbi:MAG: gamma-glutamyl-gamma-aminobutyrate hydrolase family protein [Cyclobacteriaceae bacterium]|jgi:putative glutamine amidotransferase|nr:gamma-glutamyl-gamma-aminobutyrate hydrolase family protein [Flammeovirgaceae bacterium]
MTKLIIGVTDCSKYDNYANWISAGENVETLRLSYKENSLEAIKKCHCILLTGGEDVHPRFYQKPEYLPLCYPDDMDERRDEFELSILEFSQKNRMPVLGICRGLQITNVFFGGTLIPDIPTFGKFNHSKRAGNDTYHAVSVDVNSVLYEQVNSTGGEINSAHHQSTEKVGTGLVANSFSSDGVIEGLERLNPAGQAYLSLVQWHPERMRDQSSVFTKSIKASFIKAVQQII